MGYDSFFNPESPNLHSGSIEDLSVEKQYLLVTLGVISLWNVGNWPIVMIERGYRMRNDFPKWKSEELNSIWTHGQDDLAKNFGLR